MASNAKMPMNEENPNPKTQEKTNPESDSPSSKTSGLCSPSSDPKSNNCDMNYPSFSKLLEGVITANSAVSSNPFRKSLGIQGQFGMSHREALANVTAKAAEANAKVQFEADPTKPSTKSPSVKQSKSSLSSPIIPQEDTPSFQQKTSMHVGCVKNSLDHHSNCSSIRVSSPKIKVDNKDINREFSSNFSNEHMEDVPKTPKFDGYCWRKYGQKQVKGSGSSRSYYRCTHLRCCAKKKVQHMDVSGRIIEVVYRGDHNHDPVLKGSNHKRSAPFTAPNDAREIFVQNCDDANTPPCGTKHQQVEIQSPCENQKNNTNSPASATQRDAGEIQRKTPDSVPRLNNEEAVHPTPIECCRSSNSDEFEMTDPMKEHDLAPLKKRRVKEAGQTYPDPVYRTFKEPKVVVQSAEEIGTSNDGYKWRKYGQKFVKGSPHPRSYYRCSSAGCPVRKHVERALDKSNAFLVTYEGKHNHDLPIPKKGHPLSNSSILVAKAPPSNDVPSEEKSQEADNNVNEEKTVETGGDKVLESARTLLSIGIELKSY